LLKTETLLVSKAIRISNLISRVLSVLDPQSKREGETLVWPALSPLPSLSLSLSLSFASMAENGEHPENEVVLSAGLAS